MLVDSHCHLDRIDLTPYNGDLEQAIMAAKQCGVERLLCIGTDLSNAQQVKEIAETFNNVYASVGVHPLDVTNNNVSVEQLVELASHSKVVGIGETGLDYYYSPESKDQQRSSFHLHLEAAKLTRKPVIIHTRDAKEDTISIIREHSCDSLKGVFHCFTEDLPMAEQALELGFVISFSGIVTFKNADAIRQVAKQIPLDKMLVETDSPYLAPVPFRGKKNEPKYVREVAEYLADLRGVGYEVLAKQTSENFDRLFFSK